MNVIKNIIIACLFNMLAMSGVAYAKWEMGVLLGVSGGYVRDLGLYNIDIEYTGLPFFPAIYQNDGEHDSGTVTGIIAGVQATSCDWLLGLELRWNHFDMDHHRYFNFPDFPGASFARVWNVDGQIKHGADLGLLLRLGYAMAPYLMPYMHLGVETSRDKMKVLIAGAPNVFPASISLEDKRQIYRFTGGVGIECPAPWLQAISFRLEYMFHLPGSFLEASGFIQDGFVNPLFTANIKPRTQSIEGAIVWNMG